MSRLLDRYCRWLRILLTLLMGLMLIPVMLQIVSRYTGLVPKYVWTEEAARFCFVWIIMIGSMVAVRDGTHFEVDLMPSAKTDRERGIGRLIVHLAMLLMAVVFVVYGFQFARFGFHQNSEMSGINMLWIYIAFPISGLTWALFLLDRIRADLRLINGKPSESKP